MTGEEKRDALRDLVRSPGYALVSARVEDVIERSRNELETAKDIREVAIRQGQVQALRMVLNLPDILMDEAKSKS